MAATATSTATANTTINTANSTHQPSQQSQPHNQPIDIYGVKYIKYNNRFLPILLQNYNGPCPLLAICNVLLLRERILLPSQSISANANQLQSLLKSYLQSEVERTVNNSINNPSTITELTAANSFKYLDDSLLLMPSLCTGIDVNIVFEHCSKFEYTTVISMFDLYSIRLCHSWVYEPNTPAARIIKSMSYNELTNYLINTPAAATTATATAAESSTASTTATVEPESKSELMPNNTTNTNSNTATVDSISTELSELELINNKTIVSQFLLDTQSQLTSTGLIQLNDLIKDSELVIHFRNNHFSVLTKRNNQLYSLITDAGLLTEAPYLCWQTLKSLHGDDILLDADFNIPTQQSIQLYKQQQSEFRQQQQQQFQQPFQSQPQYQQSQYSIPQSQRPQQQFSNNTNQPQYPPVFNQSQSVNYGNPFTDPMQPQHQQLQHQQQQRFPVDNPQLYKSQSLPQTQTHQPYQQQQYQHQYQSPPYSSVADTSTNNLLQHLTPIQQQKLIADQEKQFNELRKQQYKQQQRAAGKNSSDCIIS